MRISGLLKKYFVTGLLVTLPIAGTYFLLRKLLTMLEGVLKGPLQTYFETYYYTGLGIAVLLVGILLIGALTANVLGHWFVSRYERILRRVPLVSTIYSAIKSVVRTVSMHGKENFQGVVLVEFPRREMFLLAFVVNKTEGEIADKVGRPLLNLFVPTSPNPTSGYLLFVPREDVIPLSISVEEAMKSIMSGGVYTAGAGLDEEGLFHTPKPKKANEETEVAS